MKQISAINGLRLGELSEQLIPPPHPPPSPLHHGTTGGTLEEPRGSGPGGWGRRVGVLLD